MKKLLAVFGIALCMAGAAQADTGPLPKVQVSGQGTVSVAPDLARIRLGVRQQAKEAAEASGQVAVAMSSVLENLRKAGIAEKDMQTTQLRLSPMMDYSGNTSPRQVGFEAISTLTVVVRDLTDLGPVLDRVMRAGANQFEGLSFDLSDRQAAEDQARAAAVKNAVHKANLLAEVAGVSLGPVLRISEGGASPSPQFGMARMSMEADGNMPVAAGEIEISAQVLMEFSLGIEN
ncbi:hypothetical protein SAMN04488527_11110 [Aliiroseovarius crassostreae]|uniref:SIMPL domain-containing protein n=1 Tax=Aliiroseovarius crassostreae TaxID=154981 RepID=A0A0N8IB18_9RHOB|nr:SIMPL domain-containing protein [Aliiroseovarius crassostreae]KPN61867.1 hypothetical protein AKJ29_04415 [Aliiroseovarius crassostreae]SFU68952.1 hypothetical protein SAMN04488527_11110 [Aliiroseovarius crassostreae]